MEDHGFFWIEPSIKVIPVSKHIPIEFSRFKFFVGPLYTSKSSKPINIHCSVGNTDIP